MVNGEKNSKSHCDLNLDRTMPKAEFFQVIFIYHNLYNSSFRLIRLFFSYHVNRHTNTHTHTNRPKWVLYSWLINRLNKNYNKYDCYKEQKANSLKNSVRPRLFLMTKTLPWSFTYTWGAILNFEGHIDSFLPINFTIIYTSNSVIIISLSEYFLFCSEWI